MNKTIFLVLLVIIAHSIYAEDTSTCEKDFTQVYDVIVLDESKSFDSSNIKKELKLKLVKLLAECKCEKEKYIKLKDLSFGEFNYFIEYLDFAIMSHDKKLFSFYFDNYESSIDTKDRFLSGASILHIAAIYGKPFHIKELVSSGININEKNRYGNTPLFNSISNIDVDVFKELMQLGADPTIQNNHGMSVACIVSKSDDYSTHQEIIKSLGYSCKR